MWNEKNAYLVDLEMEMAKWNKNRPQSSTWCTEGAAFLFQEKGERTSQVAGNVLLTIWNWEVKVSFLSGYSSPYPKYRIIVRICFSVLAGAQLTDVGIAEVPKELVSVNTLLWWQEKERDLLCTTNLPVDVLGKLWLKTLWRLSSRVDRKDRKGVHQPVQGRGKYQGSSDWLPQLGQ